jgi:hypothetical protein
VLTLRYFVFFTNHNKCTTIVIDDDKYNNIRYDKSIGCHFFASKQIFTHATNTRIYKYKSSMFYFILDKIRKKIMADDDDVPLLNDDDDEQLITSEDRQPNVEAVFVVTFDVKYGKDKNSLLFIIYL